MAPSRVESAGNATSCSLRERDWISRSEIGVCDCAFFAISSYEATCSSSGFARPTTTSKYAFRSLVSNVEMAVFESDVSRIRTTWLVLFLRSD